MKPALLTKLPWARPSEPYTRLEDAEVNCFWVNFLSDDPDREGGPLCSVGLQRFANIFKNAREYPDVDFNLWIDFRNLDDMSRFWVESYYYANAPRASSGRTNLNLCDARDIRAYAQWKRFRPDQVKTYNHKPLFRRDDECFTRPDGFRLLLLEQRLQESKRRNIIYTDSDVPNPLSVPLKSAAAYDDFGIMIGVSCGLTSHGYIAISQSQKSRALCFLDKAISDSKFKYVELGLSGSNHKEVIGALAYFYGRSNLKIIAAKEMPRMSTEMPRDPVLEKLGIC